MIYRSVYRPVSKRLQSAERGDGAETSRDNNQKTNDY
jgi:hypothetical protein